MATYGRPGIYINEIALPQQVNVIENSAAVGCFMGALPKGPVVPTLVQSWTQFVKLFGGQKAAYRVPTAVYHFFANGGSNAYIVRMTGTAVSASATLTDINDDDTLILDAASPGAWANSVVSVSVVTGIEDLFTLNVYEEIGGSVQLVETFADLTMDVESTQYAPAVINASSTYLIASVPAVPGLTPVATVSNVALSGGSSDVDTAVDSTGTVDTVLVDTDYTAGLALLDTFNVPFIINLPDVAYYFKTGDAGSVLTEQQAIYAILTDYCETRGDAFAIVDTYGGATVANALSHAEAVKAGTGVNSAIYYPWITVPDTLRNIPGATVNVPPGPAMVGQFLATDTQVGPWKAPAGFTNRLALAVATERRLTNEELDSLNTAAVPVNAIRNVPGAGIVVMGARTLRNYPGDRYINIRRALVYIKKELESRTSFAVFENNDYRLRNALRTVSSRFLLDLWTAGGLRGASPSQAFYVICDGTNNTDSDVLNGQVNITIGVALQYPAEFVVINIGQITGNATL